jgi:hypothetical protein
MNPRLCVLPQVRCIEVRGADAQTFLHGQLSQDVAALARDRAPLAGWHDARGRLRALVRVVRSTDAWLLVSPRDMLEVTIEKLRMFVLRSDVSLTAAADCDVAALIGADDARLADRGLPNSLPRDGVARQDELHWIRLGPNLLQVLGPSRAIAALAARTDTGSATLAALAEIELGIPAMTPALIGRFVPQMLNLDQLGAISFTKGCYPGQEVIARVRNLGAVKRRMRRFAAAVASEPAPGSQIFDSDGSAVGELVRAAAAASGIELLAVVEDAAAQGNLFIGEDRTPLVELGFGFQLWEQQHVADRGDAGKQHHEPIDADP